MPSPPLLDPTLDVVFQLLFGAERNRALLRGFLTAVLRPASPITSLELLPASPERQDVDDKDTVLDLRVRFANGEQVDVEMQNRGGPAIRKRALYYWARLYAGEPERGSHYGQLRRCVVIFIANFRMLGGARFHSVFRSMEVTTGELLTEDHELHVLELPKLEAMSATNEEPADVLWGRFLSARTEAELEQLASRDPMLRRAKEALEELSADPQARLLAERRAAALRMHHVELTMTREEGEAAGEARGLAKIVCDELNERGVTISDEQRAQIASCTDLSQLRAWWKRARIVERAAQLFDER